MLFLGFLVWSPIPKAEFSDVLPLAIEFKNLLIKAVDFLVNPVGVGLLGTVLCCRPLLSPAGGRYDGGGGGVGLVTGGLARGGS